MTDSYSLLTQKQSGSVGSKFSSKVLLNDDQKVSYELEDGRDGKKSAGNLAVL